MPGRVLLRANVSGGRLVCRAPLAALQSTKIATNRPFKQVFVRYETATLSNIACAVDKAVRSPSKSEHSILPKNLWVLLLYLLYLPNRIIKTVVLFSQVLSRRLWQSSGEQPTIRHVFGIHHFNNFLRLTWKILKSH